MGSVVDVAGNGNRVAGRDLIEVNLQGARLLDAAQRKRLNVLVQDFAVEHSLNAPAIWKDIIHARLGVSSIGEITCDQYPHALELLDQERERINDQRARQQLIVQITDEIQRKHLYSVVQRYCSASFGQPVYQQLKREELRQVLAFALEQNTQKQAKVKTRIELMLSEYPLHAAGLVFVGWIAGKII